MTMCPDAFHRGEPGEAYELPMSGEWRGEGYRCPTCGFQTVTVEEYDPIAKPCLRCGNEFMGAPPVDEPEKCDACFRVALDQWMIEIKNCQHQCEGVSPICKKCGVGVKP